MFILPTMHFYAVFAPEIYVFCYVFLDLWKPPKMPKKHAIFAPQNSPRCPDFTKKGISKERCWLYCYLLYLPGIDGDSILKIPKIDMEDDII